MIKKRRGDDMKKWKSYICLIIGVLLFLTGCSVERTDQKKIKDLEFSVVEESQIPEELLPLIEEKKREDFKMTFDMEDAKYLVRGYGVQPTNGYSISVEELYITSNAICLNTNLIGPAKGEAVSPVESWPYIVIKIEYMDKSVVFK